MCSVHLFCTHTIRVKTLTKKGYTNLSQMNLKQLSAHSLQNVKVLPFKSIRAKGCASYHQVSPRVSLNTMSFSFFFSFFFWGDCKCGWNTTISSSYITHIKIWMDKIQTLPTLTIVFVQVLVLAFLKTPS